MKKEKKKTQLHTSTQRIPPGSVAIDLGVFQALLEALVAALEYRRRVEDEDIDWANVKVGGTD